jgi:acetyltransferase
MEHLIAIARERGFVLMYGDVLHGNAHMLAFAEKLGFRLEPHPDDASLHRIVLDLAPH